MIEEIVQELLRLEYQRGLGQVSHNLVIDNICDSLQNHAFYTQREKPVGPVIRGERGGYVDVFASRRGLTIGIEFDAQKNVKWKSMQKLATLNPDITVFIVGTGKIDEMNCYRIKELLAMKNEVYVLSLKDRNYLRTSRVQADAPDHGLDYQSKKSDKRGHVFPIIPRKTYDLTEIRKTYPNAYKKWTAEEERILVQHFKKGVKIPKLAVILKRQIGAILSRLRKLGIVH